MTAAPPVPDHAAMRAALDASRQAHMQLVRRAIASGFPAQELELDEYAAIIATEQLIALCARLGVGAPLVLAP